MKRKIIALLLVCNLLFLFAGCNFFKKKPSSEDKDWAISWDDIVTSGYDDIEYMEDIIYDFCIYDPNILSIESVEVVTIEYSDIETYFDKDKIYTKLGLNIDPASLLKKVAIGTGVIAVCLTLNVITVGGSSPICCIIAGAANGALTGAASGAITGGIIGALTSYISSNGDWLKTGKGMIEGAVDGYMWGAIFGAISGAVSSSYCFTGDTLVSTEKGLVPISSISVGDYVYSVGIETDTRQLSVVDEVYKNKTNELVKIDAGTQSFSCTPKHSILTNLGWKYACELTDSDMLTSYDGNFVPIVSAEYKQFDSEIDVYNLNVRSLHTYCITDAEYIVHNTCINKDYAGKTYKFENLKQQYLDTGDEKNLKAYNSLIEKYPNGVPFSKLDELGNTFPDFKEYVLWEHKFPPVNKENLKAGICLTGDSSAGSADFKMFRQKMLDSGYSKAEISDILSKYTIHHAPDCQTLQLVPRDLHQAVRHTGGASLIRQIISSL